MFAHPKAEQVKQSAAETMQQALSHRRPRQKKDVIKLFGLMPLNVNGLKRWAA
jgi:hypothetical protein